MTTELIIIFLIIIIILVIIIIFGNNNYVGYGEIITILSILLFLIMVAIVIVICLCIYDGKSGENNIKEILVKSTTLKSISNPINLNLDNYKTGQLKNIDLFNLSVIKTDKNFIGLLRGYNHIKKYSHPLYLEIINDKVSNLKIIEIDDKEFKSDKYNYGIEDPRIFLFNNEYWVMANSLGHKNQLRKNINTMCMFKLDNPNKTFTFLYHPDDVVSVQKNWSPFECGHKLYCEYSLDPHVVFQIDNSKVVEVIKSEKDFYPLNKIGRLSGGSPPILIKYLRENFYLSIGHVRTKDHSYYHFFYMFKSSPPFDLVGRSKLFKLDGKERIQFVSGMSIENDIIYVSYGINDKQNRISIFNKYDIISMIEFSHIKYYISLRNDEKLLIPTKVINTILKYRKNKNFQEIGENTVINNNSKFGTEKDSEYLIDYFNNSKRSDKLMPSAIKTRINNIDTYKIPKIIHQSFETNLLPNFLIESSNSWIIINPDYEYRYYNDLDRRNLINDNFDNDVLKAYDSLIPGAYRCDLWRFCVIYVYGGIYCDIKTGAVRPLKEIIDAEDDYLFINDINEGTILNGVFGSKKRDSLIFKVIKTIVTRVLNKEYGDHNLYPTGPLAVGAAILSELGYKEHLPIGKYKINDKNFRVYNHYPDDEHGRKILNNDGINLINFRHNQMTMDQKIMEEFTGAPNYGVLWEQRKIYC